MPHRLILLAIACFTTFLPAIDNKRANKITQLIIEREELEGTVEKAIQEGQWSNSLTLSRERLSLRHLKTLISNLERYLKTVESISPDDAEYRRVAGAYIDHTNRSLNLGTIILRGNGSMTTLAMIDMGIYSLIAEELGEQRAQNTRGITSLLLSKKFSSIIKNLDQSLKRDDFSKYTRDQFLEARNQLESLHKKTEAFLKPLRTVKFEVAVVEKK